VEHEAQKRRERVSIFTRPLVPRFSSPLASGVAHHGLHGTGTLDDIGLERSSQKEFL
jgi:hypothetical protein